MMERRCQTDDVAQLSFVFCRLVAVTDARVGLNGAWYNFRINGSTCFTGRRTGGGAG